MSVVWIVTTGNSDVKLLTHKDFSFLKDTSVKEGLLGSCYTKFKPIKNDKDDWSLPARVMGIVYGDVISEHWHKLEFHLLDGFCAKLKEENVKPDRVIVLLTDQSAIFEDRNDRDSPYWKDTCTLEPIFRKYLSEHKDIQPVEVDFVCLSPEKDQVGLDDWNATLTLVQKKFTGLGIDQNNEVIVSHQAGTPAISSAVQFASLSSFGDKVSFLTSNERTKVVSLNPSSSYFESMQIQEAKKFLNNYDYMSTDSVLKARLDRLKKTNPHQADKIIKLLEVAKLWNLSKFSDLKTKLEVIPLAELNTLATERVKQWWWPAYEEAYLAVVRYEQENFVEAFFHSYRAVEGIFCEWGKAEFKTHIILKEEHSATSKKKNSPETGLDRPYLQTSILDDPKNYFKDALDDKYAAKLKSMFEKLREESKEVVLYGTTLYDLFKVCKKNYKSICKDITRFWDGNNGIESNRNKVFHQLHGLTELELFAVWDVKNESEWKVRIKNYLNLVSEQKFETLKEASLMAQVHEKLEAQIDKLQLP